MLEHSRRKRVLAVTFLCIACLAFILSRFALPQEQTAVTPAARQDSLNRFLWKYLEGDYFPNEPLGVQYLDAFIDLNGDGKEEAIIYFASQCGSGGCGLLVLTPEDSSYSQIGYIAIARLPIRVLNRSSHGWRTLTTRVEGGGVEAPYEGELEYNGEVYTSNVNLARKIKEQVLGEVLIPDQAYEFPASPYFGTIPDLEQGKGKLLFRPAEQASAPITTLTREAALRRAVQDYLRGRYFAAMYIHGERSSAKPTDFRYCHAFFDLNVDGEVEAVVYASGQWDTILVFTPAGSDYKVVGALGGKPPIRVLPRSSDGWRNLAVHAGKPENGYEAEIPFNGRHYARRADVAPARRLEGDFPGDLLIPNFGAPCTSLFQSGP
jgi:putative lipoprotein